MHLLQAQTRSSCSASVLSRVVPQTYAASRVSCAKEKSQVNRDEPGKPFPGPTSQTGSAALRKSVEQIDLLVWPMARRVPGPTSLQIYGRRVSWASKAREEAPGAPGGPDPSAKSRRRPSPSQAPLPPCPSPASRPSCASSASWLLTHRNRSAQALRDASREN
ncbi:hypothetical protein OF846_002131 [Rhodotorula toruloides]|nr:hypothetical protein OF846_002131 [Rhodotorula toruloides]